MRHRVQSLKFHSGQDSNQMMLKKLLYNFLKSAKVVTTEKRGKAIKTYIDHLMPKTKERTEANKNYLLQYFPDMKFIDVLFTQVGSAIKDINGGYTRLTRLNQRDSDGSNMVQVEWAHPVVIKWTDKKEEIKEKNSKTKEPKTKAKPKKELEVLEEKTV